MRKFVAFFTTAVLLFACFSLVGCDKKEGERTLYSVRAEYKEGGMLEVSMTVDWFNNTQTEIGCLKFNLYPNAFREGAKYPPCSIQSVANAYPYGLNYGGITVLGCKSNGGETEWKISGVDCNILELSLKEGTFPGERAEVEVDFELKIPKCRLRLGYTDDYVNLGNWLPTLCVHENSGFYECAYSPIGDPFYSESADYKVELTVPGEYTVAYAGECLKTEVGESLTTYDFELENARDVAFVLSKKFKVKTKDSDGIRITYYYINEEGADKILNAAADSLRTYAQLFGQYAYDSLAVVSTAFVQGGMEYSGLCYISDKLDEETAVNCAAHEVAHQWWYAAVGVNQIENAYIDEGLAEYSTLLFYELNPSYGAVREELVNIRNNEYREFYGVYEQLGGSVSTVMERSLSDFKNEYEYVETCYTKSFLMLDGLRESVGDKKFFKGIKRLYADNKFGIVDTDAFIAAFERSGSSAEGFMRSFIDGKAII